MIRKVADDRRGGGERRSGADRRRKPAQVVSRRHSAPAVAGVAGTVASWAAAEISRRYSIPMEVTAPAVGVIFATMAAAYNKFILPWME